MELPEVYWVLSLVDRAIIRLDPKEIKIVEEAMEKRVKWVSFVDIFGGLVTVQVDKITYLASSTLAIREAMSAFHKALDEEKTEWT